MLRFVRVKRLPGRVAESWPEEGFADVAKSPNVPGASQGAEGSIGFNSEVGRALRSNGNRLQDVGDESSDVIIQSEQLLLLGDGFHSKSRAGMIPVRRFYVIQSKIISKSNRKMKEKNDHLPKREDGREGRDDPPRGGGGG